MLDLVTCRRWGRVFLEEDRIAPRSSWSSVAPGGLESGGL